MICRGLHARRILSLIHPIRLKRPGDVPDLLLPRENHGLIVFVNFLPNGITS